MREVVVVSAARTPFGRFGGMLKDIPRVELGGMVMREVLDRVGLDGSLVDEVYMGTTMPNQTGVLARQAALKAGMPVKTSAFTVDRACCSAMSAVGLAARSIRYGEADVAVAGGMENMSETPYVIPQLRWGSRIGDVLIQDRLVIKCPYRQVPISVDAGEVAAEYGIFREEQDLWALHTQQNYAAAEQAGKYNREIMPIPLPQKADGAAIQKDEQPRPNTTLEKLQKLSTVYGSLSVTAGNAPGLNDGATGLVLMSKEKAAELGLKPLATIISYANVAGEPKYTASIPAVALQKAVRQAGISLEDLSVIEINEAFAAMPLVSTKVLAEGDEAKLKDLRDKTNVNGGAIAIGHPVGATGARLVITMIYELLRRGGGYGGACICGGVGLGDAVIIKV